MSVEAQLLDWQNLAERTINEGYFHVPSKSTPETDTLLSTYHLNYGVPFTLLEKPGENDYNPFSDPSIPLSKY